MSNYGKRIAFNLTRKLIANGAIVISGAAYGIDSTVNNTAMYLNEPTVAVLGSGVNVPYPEKNKELLDWIGKNGMVVSEYPPNTPPNGRHFPVRNRIMSGLADAVVVVEAGEKSGAQITAQYAADQGRKVYAVPGNVGAPNSVGTNRMIRDGAKPVTCVEDILEDFEDKFKLEKIERVVRSEKYLRYEYNSLTPIEPENKPLTYKERDRFGSADGKNYRMRTKSTSADTASRGKSEKKADEKGTVKSGARKNEVLSNDKSVKQETAADGKSKASSRRDRENIVSIFDDTQRKVFDAIPDEVAVTSDTITRISGLPTDEVLSTLTMLELLAAVKALPGGLYKKII